MRNVVNVSAVTSYLAPIHVIGITTAPSCRVASKAASQARWLAAPENQDYFRGPVNVARVKEWRSRHPGYWRKRRCTRVALQELSLEQALDSPDKKAISAGQPLQQVVQAEIEDPTGASLLDRLVDPNPFPVWLTEADVEYFVSQFRNSGFQGPLNRYGLRTRFRRPCGLRRQVNHTPDRLYG